MSTIPITFNKPLLSYTVVGGTERAASTGLSAILLNRGGRYPRRTLFQELEKAGFDYIVSLEGPQDRYDLEDLSGRFPYVRFILLKETITLGDQINLGVSELSSPLFFVLWNDLRILHSGGAGKIVERLYNEAQSAKKSTEAEPASSDSVSAIKRLCTVPVIQNYHFETLPSLMAPAFYRKTVKTVPFVPVREGMPSVYPFDGVGVYDRERFIKLGGFDGTIKKPYWQLMDFGFRSYLWGEEISSTQLIRLSYNGEVPPEDSTPEESQRRFYLKNLAPVFRGDSVHIPLWRFPPYLIHSGCDLFTAWGDFSESRRWIKTNRYRFRRDARSLTDLWEQERSE
ncbi:hypothetical protein FACS1894151_00280 [Spirochaetia bacterium]|nr:hypothetical protein FACS1894151_00280 [Spirochaetia bacterium]